MNSVEPLVADGRTQWKARATAEERRASRRNLPVKNRPIPGRPETERDKVKEKDKARTAEKGDAHLRETWAVEGVEEDHNPRTGKRMIARFVKRTSKANAGQERIVSKDTLRLTDSLRRVVAEAASSASIHIINPSSVRSKENPKMMAMPDGKP